MIKKTLKILSVAVAAVFVIMQFVRPDRTNPPTNPAEILEASTAVPADVKMVLARSCADCHTNDTSYPWYSNVSPVSWFLANHIRDGRQELNFSAWGTYSARKKAKKLEEICEQVNGGEMPLPSYLWIHRDAGLSDSDRKMLCDWANTERSKIQQ